MSTASLVTGGAGFLGSHLCRRLLSAGHEVICIDNLGSGTYHNISSLTENPDFQFTEADIREDIDLPPADEIYHLASRASPDDFTEFPVRIALTNTTGTRRLLKHAARMLHASTGEMYGDSEVHPQPESYNGNFDIRGPRMRIDDGRVVPNFVTQALRNEDLTIYGDGTQTRSFCYVDDLIDGLKAVMQADSLTGDVVNLGRPNETTISELAEVILELAQTESGIKHEPLPEGDPSRRKPDISKAKRLLDWEPTTPLRAGLRQTLADFESRLE